METFNNYLGQLAQTHSVASQWGVAIVVIIGLLMCILSVVFPLRNQAEPEIDWQADTALWPFEPSAEGADSAGLGGGRHSTDFLSSVVVDAE